MTSSQQHTGGLPLSKEELLNVYRKMRTIRDFEERLHVDFGRGDIPGFVHLYAGEEAAGVGIMSHLNDGDRIASTHRGHGHCIAKGVDPIEMMQEIYGKKGGSCNGKGGSMHIADLSKGMMGANGILGAGAPLICAVTQADMISPGELDAIDKEVAALIDHAVQAAKDAPLPTAADLLTDVYVKY
ncbi:Acetoin dehydrogenase E1 component alpha-subunit [Candidatus Paraburkholderia kirkii UZHbot1]|uniref:Acetoin dehydrogenase E1 component alpha-subunit n=1 Tax=Candidatus Paraburkholderia kirkii UZHbot1 TaxID=1055526 RepID=G4MJP2_9BURK|nr:Acetoin dehydrogenase E1 component alpha-subunit [Candidatus Paraburkholderia kirkii UZHbot1]